MTVVILLPQLTQLTQQPLPDVEFEIEPVQVDRVYRITDSDGLYLFIDDFEDGRGPVTCTGVWACNDHWAVRAWGAKGLDLSVPPPAPVSTPPVWDELPTDLRMKQFLAWARDRMMLSVFYTAHSEDEHVLYQVALLGTLATVKFPSVDPESEVLPTVIEVPIWGGLPRSFG